MRTTMLLTLLLALFACDTQAPPRGTFRATVNGSPLTVENINFSLFEAPTQIGGSASHAVPNIFPRNLRFSFSILEPRTGTLPISRTLQAGHVALIITENDGDARLGRYAPADSTAAEFIVDSFDAKRGRLRGRISGVFVVDPIARGNPIRFYPDTLRIKDGAFDLRLRRCDRTPGSCLTVTD